MSAIIETVLWINIPGVSNRNRLFDFFTKDDYGLPINQCICPYKLFVRTCDSKTFGLSVFEYETTPNIIKEYPYFITLNSVAFI
jgi:hypothetical protein